MPSWAQFLVAILYGALCAVVIVLLGTYVFVP